jgi:hypothetical protein
MMIDWFDWALVMVLLVMPPVTVGLLVVELLQLRQDRRDSDWSRRCSCRAYILPGGTLTDHGASVLHGEYRCQPREEAMP